MLIIFGNAGSNPVLPSNKPQWGVRPVAQDAEFVNRYRHLALYAGRPGMARTAGTHGEPPSTALVGQ